LQFINKTICRKYEALGGISQNKKKKMEFAEIKKGVSSKKSVFIPSFRKKI